MKTIVLLLLSNVFMTVAWYGHLKFKMAPLAVVILASWLIALPEYALQVPANRLGHGQFSAPQLKILQEVISVSVFLVFSWYYLREAPRWNEWLAIGLIVLGIACAFSRRAPAATELEPHAAAADGAGADSLPAPTRGHGAVPGDTAARA